MSCATPCNVGYSGSDELNMEEVQVVEINKEVSEGSTNVCEPVMSNTTINEPNMEDVNDMDIFLGKSDNLIPK
jgi:hypothetical protein